MWLTLGDTGVLYSQLLQLLGADLHQDGNLSRAGVRSLTDLCIHIVFFG